MRIPTILPVCPQVADRPFVPHNVQMAPDGGSLLVVGSAIMSMQAEASVVI